MESINIRIARTTHRRLNFLKGQMGLMVKTATATPTIDDVINAGLDLLEARNGETPSNTTPEWLKA